MIMATDSIGIEILRGPKLLGACVSEHQAAIDIETSLTSYILAAGYEADVMTAAYQTDSSYSRTCQTDDILYEGRYYGTSLHPYETMWHKTAGFRAILPLVLERLTDWTDKMKYSSNPVCHLSAQKRNRERFE